MSEYLLTFKALLINKLCSGLNHNICMSLSLSHEQIEICGESGVAAGSQFFVSFVAKMMKIF